MQSEHGASAALTAAIQEVEAAATGTTFSVPQLRLAGMRLALAASEYRNEVVRGEVEAARAAHAEQSPLSKALAAVTPKAWRLWKR